MVFTPNPSHQCVTFFMLYGFNNEYRMFFVKQEEPQEVHKPIVISCHAGYG